MKLYYTYMALILHFSENLSNATPKKESKDLSIKFKSLQEFAAGGKKGEIANKYGVPSSTLSTWIKKKGKLESVFETM